MGFLAPVLLAGIAAMVLPWWLHRLQSKSSERRRFPSTMLLENAERQVHVQRRLKYRILMAIRMLLLLILFLAFARPYMSRDTLTNAENVPALLIDDSFSMRGIDIAATANGLLDLGPAPAQWVLLIPGQTAQMVDRSTLDQRLATFSAGFQRRDYAELIGQLDDTDLPSRVHFLTDLQGSALPARFADMVSGTQLVLPPYPLPQANVFVRNVSVNGNRVDVDVSGRVDDDQPAAQVSLRIDDQLLSTQELSAERIRFELPELLAEQHRLQIDISGNDPWPADNQFFTVIDRRPPSSVPVIVPSTSSSVLTYLRAALNADTSEFVASPYIAGRFDARSLSRFPWIIVNDPAALDAGLQTALEAYLQSGGRVVAFSGPATLAAESLPFLGNARRAAIQTSGGDLRARSLDSAHPAVDSAGDWSSVTVYRHNRWQSEDNDRVLVELADGDPWLIERNMGNGRVLFVGSALEPGWTDFASRGVFVGFVQEVANYMSGNNRDRQQFTVGDVLASKDVRQLIDPTGQRRINRSSDESRTLTLDLPGIYTVYSNDSEHLIAVNIDRRESLPDPMDAELLTRWQTSAGTNSTALASSTEVADAERRPLWPVLLVLTLLIAIAEAVLANRTQHRALGA